MKQPLHIRVRTLTGPAPQPCGQWGRETTFSCVRDLEEQLQGPASSSPPPLPHLLSFKLLPSLFSFRLSFHFHPYHLLPPSFLPYSIFSCHLLPPPVVCLLLSSSSAPLPSPHPSLHCPSTLFSLLLVFSYALFSTPLFTPPFCSPPSPSVHLPFLTILFLFSFVHSSSSSCRPTPDCFAESCVVSLHARQFFSVCCCLVFVVCLHVSPVLNENIFAVRCLMFKWL